MGNTNGKIIISYKPNKDSKVIIYQKEDKYMCDIVDNKNNLIIKKKVDVIIDKNKDELYYRYLKCDTLIDSYRIVMNDTDNEDIKKYCTKKIVELTDIKFELRKEFDKKIKNSVFLSCYNSKEIGEKIFYRSIYKGFENLVYCKKYIVHMDNEIKIFYVKKIKE